MQLPIPRTRQKVIRTLLFSFLVLTCLKVWLAPVEVVQPVHAQIPNSGQQRYDMIAELKRVNQQLTELISVVKTHTIKVRMAGADNQPNGARGQR